MSHRKEISVLVPAIWVGVVISLLIVALIAYNLNETALKENERSYQRTLTFLARSTSKSLKLFFERVTSEIILLTEVDAVKRYRTKEVDLAFRGVIANRGESISHMILLGDDGAIKVMLTNDPDAARLTPQISAFYKQSMAGWSVNLADTLLTSGAFRGVGLGMPIFRKVEQGSAPQRGPSSIYKSGMVMAIVSVDSIVKSLLTPVGIETSGFSWLLSERGELIADNVKMAEIGKEIYGASDDVVERFSSDFRLFAKGEQVTGWTKNQGASSGATVDLGHEVWLVSAAKTRIADHSWTIAVAAPRTAATAIINRGFRQAIGLFLVVVAILLAGGWLMTRAQRRWARAEERALLAETLEKKNRALKELNRRMDEFVAVVSHDIKTPLGVIAGFTKLIRSDPDGKKFERETTTMLRSTNRLTQLVNDILDVSRLEAGKIKLAYDPIVVDDLINESVMTMEFIAKEKDETISTDLGARTAMEADSSKLLQVFNNLLANAIKFTPRGGKIDVTKRVENGNVIIQVSDTGPGIPKDERATVFDKFEQVKHLHQGVEPGSGLGLTICKSLIELHGGAIGVTGAPGEGSTFKVTLPLKRAPAP